MNSAMRENRASANGRDAFSVDAAAVLDEAFGHPFRLWAWHDGWTAWEDDGQCATARAAPGLGAEWLAAHYRADQPTVVMRTGGVHGVIVPLRSPDGPAQAAVGLVETQDAHLLQRLAATALRAIDQRRQLGQYAEHLDQYAEQVSRDFEELSWLRALAEHLEYCDVANPVEEVGRAMLPSLRELIRADVVALIPVERREDAAARGNSRAERPVLRTGDCELTDAALIDVADRCGEAAKAHPFVYNHAPEHPTDSGPTGVKACILVPVAKGEYQFGWLLALNRRAPSGEATGCSAPAPRGSSELDFGTFEAGLVHAAAIMLATHARNADLFREQELLLIGVVRALSNAIEARDSYTCGHSDRVARMARRIAQELGLDRQQCERIYMTSLLHDIGKIGVPDDVLRKPGNLTADEFEIIKQHPMIAHNILKHLKPLSYVLPGVLHHHETLDGRGYPYRLRGDEIPLSARIVAVADAFDAMTSTRPYREAMPLAKAEAILQANAGKQWDRQVIDAFFRALDDIHAICQSPAGPFEGRLPAVQLPTEDERGVGSDSISLAVRTVCGGWTPDADVAQFGGHRRTAQPCAVTSMSEAS